jgi:hypothetical protein
LLIYTVYTSKQFNMVFISLTYEFILGFIFNLDIIRIDAAALFIGICASISNSEGSRAIGNVNERRNSGAVVSEVAAQINSVLGCFSADSIVSGVSAEGSVAGLYAAIVFVQSFSLAIDVLSVISRGVASLSLLAASSEIEDLGILPLEVLSVSARPASLGLRLFANITSGSLVSSLACPFAFDEFVAGINQVSLDISPISGIILIGVIVCISSAELFVGVIQSFVFSTLVREFIASFGSVVSRSGRRIVFGVSSLVGGGVFRDRDGFDELCRLRAGFAIDVQEYNGRPERAGQRAVEAFSRNPAFRREDRAFGRFIDRCTERAGSRRGLTRSDLVYSGRGGFRDADRLASGYYSDVDPVLNNSASRAVDRFLQVCEARRRIAYRRSGNIVDLQPELSEYALGICRNVQIDNRLSRSERGELVSQILGVLRDGGRVSEDQVRTARARLRQIRFNEDIIQGLRARRQNVNEGDVLTSVFERIVGRPRDLSNIRTFLDGNGNLVRRPVSLFDAAASIDPQVAAQRGARYAAELASRASEYQRISDSLARESVARILGRSIARVVDSYARDQEVARQVVSRVVVNDAAVAIVQNVGVAGRCINAVAVNPFIYGGGIAAVAAAIIVAIVARRSC